MNCLGCTHSGTELAQNPLRSAKPAAVPGAAGEYMWAGYGGTYFWVDPKEQVTAVLMTQAASPQRAYFRKQVKQLVYQAITD